MPRRASHSRHHTNPCGSAKSENSSLVSLTSYEVNARLHIRRTFHHYERYGAVLVSA